MRISTLNIFESSMQSITDSQIALNQLQEQIASGKRILSPADDPTGAASALNLRKEMNTIDQFARNTDRARTSLEQEDSILASITNTYQRLRELTVSAGSGSLTSADRSAIADEMQERLNELQSIANTRNADGEYIFSGFNTKTPAVALSSNDQYVFQGDEGERQIQLGPSTFINSLDSGKKLFFDIDSNHVTATGVAGLSQVVGADTGLINTGTLPSLDTNDLMLNGVLVEAAKSDGISQSSASQSAIAMANAINELKDQHGVDAIVNPNVVDAGVITAGVVNSGELTINGVSIEDPTGTETSLIDAINAQSDNTGVVATQPGGAGSALILTASDGRNIHLVTDGTSAASLANFDLTGGALDQIQRGSITLRDHNDVDIQGAFPTDIGFTRGVQNISPNTGTGVLSSIAVVGQPSDLNETYSIVFNADGSTFDIVANSNPTVPLEGYDDVAYVDGTDIEFEGLRMSISGTPSAGDVFGVDTQEQPTQDIFTTVSRAITSFRSYSDDPERLNYEVDLMLNNLNAAENKLIEVRAQVGARMNIVESQVDYNETQRFIAQENLSILEDLDYNEAITELSQRTFVMQAIQQTFVKIQGLSIFNFI